VYRGEQPIGCIRFIGDAQVQEVQHTVGNGVRHAVDEHQLGKLYICIRSSSKLNTQLADGLVISYDRVRENSRRCNWPARRDVRVVNTGECDERHGLADVCVDQPMLQQPSEPLDLGDEVRRVRVAFHVGESNGEVHAERIDAVLPTVFRRRGLVMPQDHRYVQSQN
jgi:hypothetical protein